MLTKAQRDFLAFLDGRLRSTGVCPSYQEMGEALGLKSKAQVHKLIVECETRGFVRRLPFKKRAIEIIRLPADMEALGMTPARATAA